MKQIWCSCGKEFIDISDVGMYRCSKCGEVIE